MKRTFMQNCLVLSSIISKKRKIQFILTVLAILASSMFEIVAIGSVIPFLSIISSPNDLSGNVIVLKLINMGVNVQQSNAVAVICLLFGVITFLNAIFRTVTLVLNSKFTLSLGADVSRVVFERTLVRPYSTHVMTNSANVVTDVIQNVGTFVNGIVSPSVQLLTNVLTSCGILVTLFVLNWWAASSAAVVFGTTYVILGHFNRRALSRNSVRIAESHVATIKALNEGVGAIRDVIIDSNYGYYSRAFTLADVESRTAHHDSFVRSSIPKYLLEAIGMLLICTVALLMSRGDNSFVGAVPMLGAMAMGAQRLLPSMQQVFNSYSSIVASLYGIDRVCNVLTAPHFGCLSTDAQPCVLHRSIRFDRVCFSYTAESPTVLETVSFEICCGERIGVIGATGSGKSTTMDLLLGLLQPTCGQILVDGEPMVGEKVFAWQKSLSHVPQVIYLADASIAENIAFGLPKDKIDMNQARKAARLAQISEHIETLEAGYDTFVGERGIRLSGGQRQRIGIARALYKNATVLVFDEATSALDDETEADLMKAIDGLSKDLTVIMIAHRLSTVRRCDKILKLHKGKVVAFDTPDVVLGPVSGT